MPSEPSLLTVCTSLLHHFQWRWRSGGRTPPGPKACPGLKVAHSTFTQSKPDLATDCSMDAGQGIAPPRARSSFHTVWVGSSNSWVFLSAQQWLCSVTVLKVRELFQNPFRHVASVPHCFFDFPLTHSLEEPQRAFVKSSSDRQLVSMLHTAKEQDVR